MVHCDVDEFVDHHRCSHREQRKPRDRGDFDQPLPRVIFVGGLGVSQLVRNFNVHSFPHDCARDPLERADDSSNTHWDWVITNRSFSRAANTKAIAGQ
jgi:hypothetical protein